MVATSGYHIFFMTKKTYYSFEDCISIAKTFDSRSSFAKGNFSAYEMLRKRGLLNDACSHMPISPRYSYKKWTYLEAAKEAAKYKNRAEFRRESAGAYGFLLKNNLLENACRMMTDGCKFWHLFELMCVAKKYTSKTDFINSEKQAYGFANRYKLTSIACAHMNKDRIDWTKELVLEEAKKYSSKGEFNSFSAGAFKHATKYNYLEEACSHMDVRKRKLDKNIVLGIAKRFKSRTSFQYGDGGAYVFARLNGFLEEACAHMKPGMTGFKGHKPANLYQIKLTTDEGRVLYKVGITNRDPAMRVYGMRISKGVDVEIINVIPFDSGRDARITEKRLHRKFKSHRYTGDPIMNNGNTELFTIPLIQG